MRIIIYYFILTELLVKYCNLLKDPPQSFDRVVLARVIHSTVHGAIQQCDVRGKELMAPIEQYFKNIRSVVFSPNQEQYIFTVVLS